MSKRSFDYKKKMDNKKKLHSKQVRKILMSSAVASTLVFQPFVPIIQNGQLIGLSEKSASAATLAEVGIFSDASVTSQLTNLEGADPYNLQLTLTGSSLIEANLVNPETVALFYSEDLAGVWQPAGNANVRVELLPLTLEDLPAVGSLLSGLTGTLTETVSEIVGDVNEILSLAPGLVEINGLEQLQTSVAALNDVEAALADLLLYEGSIPAVLNTDGSITVDFSNGIDNYLDAAVEDVVLSLLNDVIVAAQSLEVNVLGSIPIVGSIVSGLVNEVLSLATGTIVPTVQGVISQVTTGAVDLTGELVSAQVLGSTSVTLNTSISKNAGITGEVPISGAAINTKVIDLQLLNSLNTETTAAFPAAPDTEAPAAPTVSPVGEGATEVTGTAEPNSTVNVTFPGEVTISGPADGAGNFTAAVPEGTDLVVGNEISVTATDAADNTSPATLVTVTDETAPDAPVISLLDNTATEVTGTAEPGSIVTVTFPEGETVSTTADGEGNFSVVVPPGVELIVGDTVSAIATDAAGNNSNPGTIAVTEVDNTAPDAPTVNDVGENDTEVTGTAEAGSEITVTLPGGEIASGTTDEDGNFVVILPEGTELVAGTDLGVTATDATGNESDSTTVTVGDETAPAAPTVNPVDSNLTEVTGEAEPNSTITITLPNGTEVTGTTNGDGTFAVDLPEDLVLEGGEVLLVTATDAAYNESASRAVTVADATAPVISPIDDVTIIEGLPIEPIEVEVNEAGAIDLSGLPEGLVYDDETGLITGTLSIADWGVTEEERDLDVSLTATDEAGNESDAEEFVLTI